MPAFPQVSNALINPDNVLYVLQDENDSDRVWVVFVGAAELPLDTQLAGVLVFEGAEARIAWERFGGGKVALKTGDEIDPNKPVGPGQWKED